MKLLLFIFVLALSTSSYSHEQSNCLPSDVETYLKKQEKLENLYVIKNYKHKIIYTEDSCGANGCEIRVFTKVTPFCTKETLTTKGFYIDKSLNITSLEIRKKGKTRRYKYVLNEMRFK